MYSEKMKIIWILRNSSLKKPHLAALTKISAPTFYSILDMNRSVLAKTERRLDAFIESMREEPRLTDASLLLPDNLDQRWRWASYDVANGWLFWDSDLPPIWEMDRKVWRSHYPSLSPRSTFPVIPADASAWAQQVKGESLYKRDALSGFWVKTYGKYEANPMPTKPYNKEDLAHLKDYYQHVGKE